MRSQSCAKVDATSVLALMVYLQKQLVMTLLGTSGLWGYSGTGQLEQTGLD